MHSWNAYKWYSECELRRHGMLTDGIVSVGYAVMAYTQVSVKRVKDR